MSGMTTAICFGLAQVFLLLLQLLECIASGFQGALGLLDSTLCSGCQFGHETVGVGDEFDVVQGLEISRLGCRLGGVGIVGLCAGLRGFDQACAQGITALRVGLQGATQFLGLSGKVVADFVEAVGVEQLAQDGLAVVAGGLEETGELALG